MDYICPNLMGPENEWEGVAFIPANPAEQSHQGKPIARYYFPSFTGNPKFCPVVTQEMYEERTEPLIEGESRQFITVIRPHKVVTSSSITRWLKTSSEAAGVDMATTLTKSEKLLSQLHPE